MQKESLSSSGYGNLGAASVKSPEMPVREPSINVNDDAQQHRQQDHDMVNEHGLCLTQYQDLLIRHSFCLTRLREVEKEVEILRQENASLQTLVTDMILIKSSDFDNNRNNNVEHVGSERGVSAAAAAAAEEIIRRC